MEKLSKVSKGSKGFSCLIGILKLAYRVNNPSYLTYPHLIQSE